MEDAEPAQRHPWGELSSLYRGLTRVDPRLTPPSRAPPASRLLLLLLPLRLRVRVLLLFYYCTTLTASGGLVSIFAKSASDQLRQICPSQCLASGWLRPLLLLLLLLLLRLLLLLLLLLQRRLHYHYYYYSSSSSPSSYYYYSYYSCCYHYDYD